MTQPTEDWFWATGITAPVGDRFIIENGQDALFRRVLIEIDRGEQCNWMPMHKKNKRAQLEDVLDMMLTIVPSLGVNLNKFVCEAAKIPAFAFFLRNARYDLCNYISNTSIRSALPAPEPYSDAKMRKLGRIVSNTLGCTDDWF